MACLRYILLLHRDVPRAAKFYNEGLGLPIKVLTERWAELQSGTATIALQAVDGCVSCSILVCTDVVHRQGLTSHLPHPFSPREAFVSTGYTPFLSFQVTDLQSTLTRCLQLGAAMDGGVKYTSHGKVYLFCTSRWSASVCSSVCLLCNKSKLCHGLSIGCCFTSTRGRANDQHIWRERGFRRAIGSASAVIWKLALCLLQSKDEGLQCMDKDIWWTVKWLSLIRTPKRTLANFQAKIL